MVAGAGADRREPTSLPEIDPRAATTGRATLAVALAFAVPGRRLRGLVDRAEPVVTVDVGRPSPWSVATVLRPLDPGESAAALGRVARVVERPGATGDVHLWAPSPMHDPVDDRWGRRGGATLMWRPPLGAPGSADPDRRVEVVRDPRDLRTWAETAVGALGLIADPDDVADLAVAWDAGVRLHWARSEGRPVGVAVSVRTNDHAAVPLLGVLPEWRRRGFGTALLRRVGESQPDVPVALLADEATGALASRCGYRPLGRWAHWVLARP